MPFKVQYTMPLENRKYLEVEVTGEAGYTAGTGQIITAAQLGLNRICGVTNSCAVTISTQAPVNAVFPYLNADRAEQGSERVVFIWGNTVAGGTDTTESKAGRQFRAMIWGY